MCVCVCVCERVCHALVLFPHVRELCPFHVLLSEAEFVIGRLAKAESVCFSDSPDLFLPSDSPFFTAREFSHKLLMSDCASELL